MENNKAKKICIVALITSILPLLTLIPVFLGITLPNYLRYSWTEFNMISVLLSFILSIIGVRCNKERCVSLLLSQKHPSIVQKKFNKGADFCPLHNSAPAVYYFFRRSAAHVYL